MNEPACKHEQKRLIARDDDSQYFECIVCGEILEAGELKQGDGYDESLSDA